MGHRHGAAPSPAGRGPGAASNGAEEVRAGRDSRLLVAALALIVGFMAVELVVGLAVSSLALVSDAGHMLTDAVALALALLAARLATRPARGNYTFGLRRVEILSAQANGLTLVLLALFFTVEAVRRLLAPPPVQGGPVLLTALAGVAVNVAAAWLVGRAQRRSLNVEGAFAHLLTDLYAFVATAAAGLVVLLTGWREADSVATLVVAGLMARAGYRLLRDSWRIFLEAAPRGIDVASVDAQLHALDGVVEIHDLHVWEVTSGFPALSAHLLVASGFDCHERREAAEDLLRSGFGIGHTTLQVDHRRDLVPSEELFRNRRRSDGHHRAERGH